eukprot:scaffold30492_cov33-Phaeocystis_antarctica.AAC.1
MLAAPPPAAPAAGGASEGASSPGSVPGRAAPVVPRYAVRTARPGLQLPCASGTYAKQEAGTRSLYVQYGGSGAYGSAQSSTSSGGSSHSTQATSAPMSRTCQLWVDGRSSPRPADCRPRSSGSASSLASSLIGPNSILGELKQGRGRWNRGGGAEISTEAPRYYAPLLLMPELRGHAATD